MRNKFIFASQAPYPPIAVSYTHLLFFGGNAETACGRIKAWNWFMWKQLTVLMYPFVYKGNRRFQDRLNARSFGKLPSITGIRRTILSL